MAEQKNDIQKILKDICKQTNGLCQQDELNIKNYQEVDLIKTQAGNSIFIFIEGPSPRNSKYLYMKLTYIDKTRNTINFIYTDSKNIKHAVSILIREMKMLIEDKRVLKSD